MLQRKKWAWPAAPMTTGEITLRLGAAKEENIDYARQPVLGFPGTCPLPAALDAAKLFLPTQANNIGLHTEGRPAEMGFNGTQALEMEFVYSLASLLGSNDPEIEVDGYICSGGTDGNDHGMWLGRNWLRANVKPDTQESRGIVVITSFLTHYSVAKQFERMLGMEETVPHDKHDNVLRILSTDENGRLSADILEKEIREYFEKGYRRFLIFLTAGTINIGSIDPVENVNTLLGRLELEFCKHRKDAAGFYVHVDAAYGGLVIPFVHPENRFGFENPYVRSISVDAHKMGYVPYSAGVFLCRKGLLKHTETEAKYLYGHSDCTVPGSRSGSTAAACWAAMHSMGFEGYQQLLMGCMERIEILRKKFVEGRYAGEIQIFPSELNILTICPDGKVARAMIYKNSKGKALFERFLIPQTEDFPRDLTKATGKDKVPCTMYRFLVMPHCGLPDLNRFIEDLEDAIDRV